MDSKFKLLVEDPNLYPVDIVSFFGKSDPHWEMESWKARERSLAHDVVCMLLCNMELSENSALNMINDFIRKQGDLKRKAEAISILEGPSTSKQAKLALKTQDCEEEDFIDDECGFHSSDDEDVLIVEEDESSQKFFRYKLLEGLPTAAALQRQFITKWVIREKTKLFDIIDSTEMKLIEVKLSLNAPARIYDYSQDLNTCDRTALIVVNPTTAQIESVNKNDEMPGVTKMTNWLIQRKFLMETLGINDEVYDEGISLSDFIFTNNKLNTLLGEYNEMIIQGSSEKQNGQMINTLKLDLQDMNAKNLFEKLTQEHLSGDQNEITWDGKILPPIWKNFIETEGQDIESIDDFINYFHGSTVTNVQGDGDAFEFYNKIVEKWDSLDCEGKNFLLYNTSNYRERTRIPQIIKDHLGIDMKKRTCGNTGGMKQHETKELPKRKYAKWFDLLMEKMATPHQFSREYSFHLDVETKDRLQMNADAQIMIEMLNKTIGAAHIGIMMSEYTNVFSRLSSAYIAGVNKNGSHSRIVILPIVSNYTKRLAENYVNVKRVSGFIVRGPCHMRSMSDRNNFVSCELINDDFSSRYVKNANIISFSGGQKMLIRKNAYKKLDGPYLTFIRNAAFNPANLLGEMIVHMMCKQNRILIDAQARDILSDFEKSRFIIDRVVENVVMAAIGNSRDEGYFAMLRKLLMILLNMRRGNCSFSLNIDEFCDSVNECIIDNPLSMFFHNSILFVLAYYIKGSC